MYLELWYTMQPKKTNNPSFYVQANALTSAETQRLDSTILLKTSIKIGRCALVPSAASLISSYSDLRAVDNLEPLSFPEAEVVFCPRLIVIKCHKEGDSCRGGAETQHQHSVD